MKLKINQMRGITLIVLVITIIVLLILAGVSIATLTGENGILTRADNAKTETTKAEAREMIQLETAASFDNTGKYNVDKAIENLKNNAKIPAEDITKNDDRTLKVKLNGYEFSVDENGKVGDLDEEGGSGGIVTFNPEELTIGAPVLETTSKYGWKVIDYTVKTTDCPSGVWRLFYQDSNYTYLINDELTATSYKPIDYYDTIKDENGNLKYQTGEDVSTVGQKLNAKISSSFTDINTNHNMRFTAWVTDPGAWSDYVNEDAVFAIGSPTAELFAASYNNRSNKSNIIEVNKGTYGYKQNTSSNWLSKSDNKGIYNKDGSSNWWLASPRDYTSYSGLYVNGGSSCFNDSTVRSYSYACRPTVCILTSIFDSDYADSLKDE